MDRRERANDPGEALLAALQGWQANLWTAMPAIIDPAKMTVSAQVSIQAEVRDEFGEWRPEAISLLVDCPVVFPGGGGYCLTFPIKQGDEALIVFASRCIDAWWQSGGVQRQADFRLHSLSDGFALVGVRSVPRVPIGINTFGVELRSDDGNAVIEINDGNDINITTPGNITLTAPLVHVQGNLTVTGVIDGVDVNEQGVNLKTHVHSGVTTGGGNTGQPV
jgi:hypothetical protein